MHERMHWCSPLEEFMDGPACMSEYRIINNTEWDGEQLSAALATEIAAMGAPFQVSDGTGSSSGSRPRGRPAAEAWWRVMVEVGAWLCEHGAPENLSDVERYIADRLAEYGQPDANEGHVRQRAGLARDTFVAWRERAGN